MKKMTQAHNVFLKGWFSAISRRAQPSADTKSRIKRASLPWSTGGKTPSGPARNGNINNQRNEISLKPILNCSVAHHTALCDGHITARSSFGERADERHAKREVLSLHAHLV